MPYDWLFLLILNYILCLRPIRVIYILQEEDTLRLAVPPHFDLHSGGGGRPVIGCSRDGECSSNEQSRGTGRNYLRCAYKSLTSC